MQTELVVSTNTGGLGGKGVGLYLINDLEEFKEKEYISVIKNKEFTYYSLFAGIGGMTMGLEPLGGKCLGAWEFDPFEKTQFAQQAHKLLHPHIPIYGDVTKINPYELEDFDVLAFTPPCQSFSISGKRGGFEDTRGTLTFNALEIAKVKKPKVLFMENVKGLLNHDKGKTMSTIVHAINEIGYLVDFTILNSRYFGVPQNRERVYLVAIRKDIVKTEEWGIPKGNSLLLKTKRQYVEEGLRTFNFEWPKGNNEDIKLKDFLDKNVDEDYYLAKDKIEKLVIPQLDYAKSCSLRTRNYCGQPQQLEIRKDDVSNTITTVSKDTMVVEDLKIRKLTAKECLRLQAVPEIYADVLLENFSQSRCYKFAGNGLTINVVKEIGINIIKYL